MKTFRTLWVSSLMVGLWGVEAHAARQVEKLDRGLVAVSTGGSNVFVSWRLQGYEPLDLGFDLYRNGTRLNNAPITGATQFTDNGGSSTASYTVRAVANGKDLDTSKAVQPWAGLTRRIPLQRPAGGTTKDGVTYIYSPNDMSVGDLDGDGEYELILKWDPSNAKDNSQSGYTGNVFIDALKLDGTLLWRIDLGVNIRAGAHYTQFMVADFDGNGRAEMIVKTAPMTRDASGNYLSKGAAKGVAHVPHVNSSGFIIEGEEFLTVFGSDGMELATVPYNPGRAPTNGWGKTSDNTNRVDRFLGAVAYLDGVKPYAVMQRGYYGRMTLAAWSWDGVNLTQKWFFDTQASGNGGCYSQGNHNLSVADVDGDGNDEIIQGACAIDHDGKFMYATGLGHGDAIHLSDLMPDRPGLEVMSPHEEKHMAWPGTEVHDARTGQVLWKMNVDTMDVGRGMAADISAAHRGFEVWSSGTDGVYNIATGTRITTSKPSINFRIYWDGDLQDEMLDGIGRAPSSMKIEHWNGSGMDRLVSSDTRYGSYVGISINGTKSNPNLVADILGDWREEMILRESGDQALILYTTVIPTTYRIYTLMHDPVYRASVAWQNVAYNQPTHLGFFIGDGLANLPIPDIAPVGGAVIPVEPRDCADTPNGTAVVDVCGQCAGGNTGVTACTLVQELEEFCVAAGVLESTNAGFSETGYLNLDNSVGAGATWGIQAASAGSRTLVLRYANGSANARPVAVAIDGVTRIASLDLPSTGGWAVWKPVLFQLDVPAGQSMLSFEALTAEGAPNLDLLDTTGVLQSGPCEATTILPGTVRGAAGWGVLQVPRFDLLGRSLTPSLAP